MKRSEAIAKIIENHYMSFGEAERILETLEKIGMLPPSKQLNYKDYQAIRQCSSDPFEEYHKWDKEDIETYKPWSDDEIPF